MVRSAAADGAGDGATLGTVVRDLLSEQGRNQSWLGVEVARQEGRSQPYSQANVSEWLSGARTPSPRQVFAMERALAVPPGALSQLEGYLPVEAHPTPGLDAMIDADPDLTADQRAMLRTVYEQARERTRSRRRR